MKRWTINITAGSRPTAVITRPSVAASGARGPGFSAGFA